MPGYAIGVDLGGTNLRIAAVDESGKLLEKVTTGTQVARGRDHVINDMCAAIRSVQEKFREPLLGMGIGVPGIIDMETGTVLKSPNLPGWEQYLVRDEIERRLNTVVMLENDANAAALGEKWLGAAREVESMLMLTLGTGIGGGVVLDGKVWRGMTGMAAELGHVTVDPEGVRCGCGNRGCVEQYASATAIKRMALEAIAGGNAPELAQAMKEDPEFSSRIVFQMASQGDASAKQIFERAGRSLGIALAGFINIFNVPMYVIGGGVAAGWEAFAPAMLDEIRQRCYIFVATEHGLGGKKSIITRALLGSDAGLYGAARLPMIEGAPKRRREVRSVS